MRTCTSPGPGGGGSGTSRNASTSDPPNASHTIAFICRATLSPIVEYEEPRPAIARLVRAVHRDPLDLCAEAAPQHQTVGFLARQIDPGQDCRHAGRNGELGAGVEQRGKAVLGSRSHRAKLDEAAARAGLARRAPMADREAGETAVAIPQQRRVAELAGEDGTDLGP